MVKQLWKQGYKVAHVFSPLGYLKDESMHRDSSQNPTVMREFHVCELQAVSIHRYLVQSDGSKTVEVKTGTGTALF